MSNLDRPAIGGLLRLAWQMHRNRLYEAVAEAGFGDISRAQFELFRWPGIDGLRPSEAAHWRGLSKQAVNDLLRELEAAGYVDLHPDTEDGRARVIRLTARGRRLQRTAHKLSLELEEEWARTLGAKRFAALRTALEEMVERGLPAQA